MPMNKVTKKSGKNVFSDWITSFAFVLPVVVGIALFTIAPMISSLGYSFTRTYTTVKGMGKWGWFDNYKLIFGAYRKQIFESFGTTFLYTLISLPLNLIFSFALALALAKDIKGIRVFRVIYYLPVMLPAVVSGILWSSLANGSDTSAFNIILNAMHLKSFDFYDSEKTAFSTFIFMGLFSIGGSMILWIAQIKAIPDSMFEVADLEGAPYFVKLFKIIIPMCTPMIFYNLIMGIINSLQVFSNVVTLNIEPSGKEQLDFIVVRIYDFYNSTDLSVACALSWLLFLVIAAISALTFRFNKWVYYGEEA